jgi:transposase-like protein
MASGKHGSRDVELTSAVTEGEASTGGGGEAPAGASPCGRPQRPSVEAKEKAVLEILAGKATVEQIVRRLAVTPETVEGWRAEALEGVRNGLRYHGRSPREVELERDLRSAKDALGKAMIYQQILEKKQEMLEAKAKGFQLPRYGM